MSAGRMFGEMSIMSRDAKASASIVANSQPATEIHVIELDFVYNLFKSEPALCQRFYYNVCLKLVGMIKNVDSGVNEDRNKRAEQEKRAAAAAAEGGGDGDADIGDPGGKSDFA